MTFIHGYLLAGLVLVGVPILVHLIMKQKPRLLAFPAFRFLRQTHLINRRKLMLQHWLLMLLRMVLIAALVLALTRPRLAGEWFSRSFRAWVGAGVDRPVSAVFVFDTSYSMDYRENSQSRLDLARLHALGLYREMAEGSRVAVLDTGDDETEEDWMTTPSQVRGRLTNLRLRPVLIPLTRQIDRARRMLQQEAKEENAPMPLLYIFSDRTRTSWDSEPLRDFHKDDDPNNPITVVYVDVGADKPEDISIESIKVEPATVLPGKPIQVRVAVRATGRSYNDYVACQLEGDLSPLPRRVQVKLEPGQSKVVSFELHAPQRDPGASDNVPYQAFGQLSARLITPDNRPFVDALAFNNTVFATFLIRDDTRRLGRKVLTLVDSPGDKQDYPPYIAWEMAFKARVKTKSPKAFDCDIRTMAEAQKMTAKDLERYRVVCLFEAFPPVADPLWDKLKAYVQSGGGLVLVPGGEEWEKGQALQNFNEAASKHDLLPAKLRNLITLPVEKGITLVPFDTLQHPLMLPFREWIRSANPDFSKDKAAPVVNRFWLVEPTEKEGVIVSYDTTVSNDNQRVHRPPALVEKSLDRGRVVLFTVPLDWSRRFDNNRRRWHNYWDSSFGMILVNELASYLAGDASTQELDFWAGQSVAVPLPPETQARTAFKLDSPDPELSDSERTVQAPKATGEAGTVSLPQAAYPGNYRLLDRRDQAVAAFSLNIRPEESQLAQMEESEIEAVLGPGSVLKASGDVKLADTMQANKPAPLELLPLLMVLVLLALTLEGCLANRFYRGEQVVGPDPANRSRT